MTLPPAPAPAPAPAPVSRPRRPLVPALVPTLTLAALALPACGYHALSPARGPLGGHALALLAVDAVRPEDAPLASFVSDALPLELGRAGVPLRPAGAPGAATFRAVVEPVTEEVEAYPRAPDGFDPPSATTGRLPGVFGLQARLRVEIDHPDGTLLWHGTLVARAAYAESASLAERAASRDRAERALAAELAARLREVLVR